MRYVGRFAPSPTGPLHLGSLTAAVASFLHARQANGAWLVRIEDIDPPREVPGAADGILRTLEAYALEWDGPVLYQSTRRAAYEVAVEWLLAAGLAFRCSCTRGELRAQGSGPYPGTCRTRSVHRRETAVRARVDDTAIERFVDGVQGEVELSLAATTGDFVIWRRDGLPAYHLAVVVDDDAQGVTTVVRGADLLDSTPAHLHLQRLLGLRRPAYFHVPVLVDGNGVKLSKQTGAAPVDARSASATAVRVLELLGALPPGELRGAAPAELWRWALTAFRIEALAGRRAVPYGADEPERA